MRITSNYTQDEIGVRFESVTLPAMDRFCGGEWGTMSQLSIIFGMPLMLVHATELTNCGDTSQDLDEVRFFLSEQPLDTCNSVARLLLVYMANHYQSVDGDFGTIPERCVGRYAPMPSFGIHMWLM